MSNLRENQRHEMSPPSSSHRAPSSHGDNHFNPFNDPDPFADTESFSSRNSSIRSVPVNAPPRARLADHPRDHILPVTPPESHELSEKVNHQHQIPSSIKPRDPEKQGPSVWDNDRDREKSGLWKRFKKECEKNYCPKESPPLVLPTCPTDKEKYSYVAMRRVPILISGLLSTAALSIGAWLFLKASWWYFWYALYAVLSEFYIFTSFGITAFGKGLDLPAWKKMLEDTPLNEHTAPTVDIYLPVCKEPIEILENTWKHITQLKYPNGKLLVFVLDDGAQDDVKGLCERFGFKYICRPNRPELKKAGNMRYAFAQTKGDFFVVFDADFCPRPDFLTELMPQHIVDNKIAILQTPQFFRSTSNQTWVEQGAGSVQEYFYRLVQPCRNTWGGAICVGSNAIYRRAALEAVGGTAPADCSEDVHTGFYAVTRGWKVRYVPLVLACGVCPDIPRAFFSQQMRWCTGSLSLLTHGEFWKSSLSLMQKFCYLTGFFYYSTTALSLLLNPIPAPLILWTHPELFKYYNLFFAFPSVFLGLIVLRLWSRSPYTLSVQYCQVIMQYAYLHAIWDRFFGTKMSWLPSGDGKAHKNNRYRNMRIMCWAWTITHNTLLITGAAYRISQGMEWYQIIPAMALDAFNFLCVHRFLLYQHPKSD